MADDFSTNTSTSARVAVGGAAGGNIETAGDRDWFEVALVMGDLPDRSRQPDEHTLRDPRLAGDASGDLISGTVDDNGGRLNAQVRFTASTTGTYYIVADESATTANHLHAVGGGGRSTDVSIRTRMAGALRYTR